MCIVHYSILSLIFYHCVQFADCLLCVRIFHLWTLWILTFLPSHHTISNFLLYYFMIMSFRKRKMSTFLHCSYFIFFLLVFYNQSMESCDILDQFSAALFESAVLLNYFKFHNTSAIQ